MLTSYAILGVMFGCASQRAPTGGAEDKTPPRILKVYPDSAATNFRDRVIRITFDKYISTSTLQPALFFSPALDGAFEISWNGREAEIRLDSALKADRTYSYTVTNTLRDTRGNALDKSYSFAFSTGGKLDSGRIGGTVFDRSNRPVSGVLAMGYFISDSARTGLDVPRPMRDTLRSSRDTLRLVQDTLNPGMTKPDYIAQSDNTGRFDLRYLKTGNYRLVVIRDANNDLLFDERSEEFAVTTVPLVRTDTLRLTLRLAKRDTTKPELQFAEARHSRLISLRFDRNLVTDTAFVARFRLYDSTAKQAVRIFDFYTERQQGRDLVFLCTDSLNVSHTFGLEASALIDESGNRADSLRISFTGSDAADTTKLLVSYSQPDSVRSLFERTPPPRQVELSFNAPFSRATLGSALTLRQATGKIYQPVEPVVSFRDARRVSLSPKLGFRLGAFYELEIDHRKLRDVFGRPAADTVFVRRFEVVKEEQLGGIEGELTVTQNQRRDLRGNKVIVSAELIGSGLFYTQPVLAAADKTNAPLKFAFNELPEGKYFLSSYIVRDSGDVRTVPRWSDGAAFPFAPAAPFAVSLDSIRVRKRWTTSDVKLTLP